MAKRTRRGTKETGLSEEWRNKIKATQIMNRLMSCINGEVELSPQQIKAADIILKKIEPDLARTEVQPLDENGEKSNGFVLKIEHVKAPDRSDT